MWDSTTHRVWLVRCGSARWIAAVVGILLGLPARRTVAEEAGGVSDRVQAGDSWGEVSTDAGLGAMGRDLVTTFQFQWDVREGAFAMGLGATVRVVALAASGAQKQGLRSSEWDEPSDFAHILRYLSYRRRLGPVDVSLLAGEFLGSRFGAGLVLDRYVSVLDLDHPHSGARLYVGHPRAEGELLVGDFVDPHLLAARFAVRPVQAAQGLVFQVATAWDRTAPLEDGRRAVGVVTGQLAYDQLALGLFRFAPDLAFGWGRPGGMGFQAGGRVTVSKGAWRLEAGAWYRLTTGGFAFGYFDAYYDVQRTQFGLGPDGWSSSMGRLPKAQVAAGIQGLFSGGLWRLRCSVRDLFELDASYELRTQGYGDMAFVSVDVPAGRRFVAGLLVGKTGLRSASDWTSREGLLAGLDIRWRFWRFLYLLGQFRSLYWHTEGHYEGIFLGNVALGAALDYAS